MAALRRVCAKVLLVDPNDRVLLFSGIDRTLADQPPVWFLVGGAVEDGETLDAAAVRETGEETGFEIGDTGLPLFTRRFNWVFERQAYDQEGTYFLVRVSGEARPTGDGPPWRRPRSSVIGGGQSKELRRTDETVYPAGLADILERFL